MWTNDATKAFNQLKEAVTRPQILSLLDFNQIFIIECNVCAQVMKDSIEIFYNKRTKTSYMKENF